MNKTNTLFAALAIAAAAATTQAQTYFINPGTSTGTTGTTLAAGQPFGTSFYLPTGSGINISAIGIRDTDGLTGNYTVGVYSISGSTFTLIGSTATVTPSSTLDQGYRWVSVNVPVSANPAVGYGVIVSGGTYTADAVGDTSAGDTVNYNAASGVILPGFADAVGGTLPAPVTTAGQRWNAVNFQYTPVPEPETYAMIAGVGLVAFGLWRRRQ